MPLARSSMFFTAVLAAVLVASAPALGWDVGSLSEAWTDAGRGDREVPVEIRIPAAPGGGWAAGPGGEPIAFPVLVFGHATLTPWSEYDHIFTAVAAAGAVVALPRTEMGFPPDQGAFAADMAFVASRLRELGSTPGSAYAGRISPRFAFAGHSLGGGAAILAAAAGDAAGVVALAPQNSKPAAAAAAPGVAGATLTIVGGADCVTPAENHALPIHSALVCEPRAYVEIAGAGHCGFAAGVSPCADAEAGCGQTMAASEQRAVAAALAVPWLLAALGTDPGAMAVFAARLDSIPGLEWELTGSAVPAAEGSWGRVKGLFR